MSYINFETKNTAPYSNDPIQAGDYNSVILKIENKKWNNNGEEYLNVTFKITDRESPFFDRLLFINLNINNQNEDICIKNRNILDQICTICKVKSENGSLNLERLYAIPLHIHIGVGTSSTGRSYNKLYGVGTVKENKFDLDNNSILHKTPKTSFLDDDLNENPF